MDLAADGAAALDRLAAAPPDAVVLDVSMPGLDGLEVCRRMRQAGDRTPVLMLTARDAVDDRVEGLDAGADDYLVKPFALRELRARLRALLRRVDRGAAPCASPTSRWTPTRTRCTAATRRIELSRTEFALLELFMRHPRQVLTRTQIFESVWGYDLGATSNALGVYIGYLRRKTEAGRRAAPAAHGPRRGLRAARGLIVALRARLTLMSALIVGVTLVLASLVAYAAVRSQQRGAGRRRPARQRGLLPGPRGARRRACRPGAPASARRRRSLGGPGGYAQLVRPNGNALQLGPAGGPALPVTRAGRWRRPTATPPAASPTARSTALHLRVLTATLGPIGAVQVGALARGRRPRARSACGACSSRWWPSAPRSRPASSRLFSRRVVAPVTELTDAAEHIEATGDLGRRIDARRPRRGRADGRALQRDARRACRPPRPSSASWWPTPRTSCARR